MEFSIIKNEEYTEEFTKITGNQKINLYMYSNSQTRELAVALIGTDEEDAVCRAIIDSEENSSSYVDSIKYKIENVIKVENAKDYDILTCDILLTEDDEIVEGTLYVSTKTNEVEKLEIEDGEKNIKINAMDDMTIDLSIFNNAEEVDEEEAAMLVLAGAFALIMEGEEETGGIEYEYEDEDIYEDDEYAYLKEIYGEDLDSYFSKEIKLTLAKEDDVTLVEDILRPDCGGIYPEREQNGMIEYYVVVYERKATVEEYADRIERELGYEVEMTDTYRFNFTVAGSNSSIEEFGEKIGDFCEAKNGLEYDGYLGVDNTFATFYKKVQA